MRRSLLAASLAVALLSARDGRAQSGGSAEAEELFKQGRTALEAKDYPTACTRLHASLELERAVGTLISLAECEEAQTQLAGARQHWQEAADLADATHDRLNRGAFARARFAAVDPRVPRLVVHLAAGAPPDTTFHRDDVALPSHAFDVPLPVDPGAHTITVVAAGHDPRAYRLDLAEAARRDLDVEPGAETVIAPPTPSASERASPASPPSAPSAAAPRADAGSRRTVTYSLIGVGGVGLAIGTFFGVTAFSKWSSAKSDCGSGCAVGSPARSEQSAASTAAAVSTIAFAAGGASLAVAAVLYFTAPSTRTGTLVVTPTVGVAGAGLEVRAAW